jgi:ABC-2 type transport system ATP-binding protein
MGAVDRSIAASPHDEVRLSLDSIVRAESLTKRFDDLTAVDGISFRVEKGECFGILGPNGAGKTTTIRIILGLLKASAGTTRVLGGDPGDDRIRNKVGFLLEVDGLYDNLSAQDNLAYYGRLYGLRHTSARIATVLEGAGLTDRALDKISTYSKGMRQRLALARSMLHQPEVLVLDEPTAGLDPGGQSEVRRMLLDLSRNEGKTIFLSSHNLDEMQRLCNRIVLIHGGEIKLYGDLSTLAGGSGRRGVEVETGAPIPEAVLSELSAETGAAVESQAHTVVRLSGGADFEVPRIVGFLVARGVDIEQVTKQRDSLEDLYLRSEAEARAAGEAPGEDPAAAAGSPTGAQAAAAEDEGSDHV